MNYELDSEEVGDAAHALIGWLESQDLTPQDAVRVLTTALVAVIHEVAVTKGLCPRDGGKIIADIIVESLP